MPQPVAEISVDAALRKGTQFLKSLGIEAARLEMELIMADALGLDRLGLYLNLQKPLTPEAREKSRAMLARRREREPIAYILGHREFYGLSFEVNRAVLIPRPETELLVDRALKWLAQWDAANGEPVFADIGIGSGAIAIAVAHVQIKRNLPGKWIATDVSTEALEVARRNAEKHAVSDRIEFREGSDLDPLMNDETTAIRIDCLCSNPPYIAETDRETLPRDVIDWEPHGALFSGAEGLDCIGRIIEWAPKVMNPGAVIFLEIGMGQKEGIENLFSESTRRELWDPPIIHDDLSGIPRIVEAHLKPIVS